MNTWLARVRFGVAYPDWAGLLAVGLALVALVLHGVILPAQEDRLAELEQQVVGVEKSARRLRMRTDAVATTQASAGERRFLARVREQLPGCAIEEVSLQRQRIEDDTLTAQVRLVFFVRRGDAS